jgi:hypothetical protein
VDPTKRQRPLIELALKKRARISARGLSRQIEPSQARPGELNGTYGSLRSLSPSTNYGGHHGLW